MKPAFLLSVTALLGLMAASALQAQSTDPAASPVPTTATSANATSAAEVPKVSGRQPSAKALEKYDTDRNGVLDPEEKAARKKDRAVMKAERLKKYDKNGDGKLDGSEKAAMKADKKVAKSQ